MQKYNVGDKVVIMDMMTVNKINRYYATVSYITGNRIIVHFGNDRQKGLIFDEYGYCMDKITGCPTHRLFKSEQEIEDEEYILKVQHDMKTVFEHFYDVPTLNVEQAKQIEKILKEIGL